MWWDGQGAKIGVAQEREVVNVKNFRFTIVVEKDSDGYFAFCPQLQGCYAQGETYEETVRNAEDAIRLHVEDRLAAGEEIDQAEQVSLTTLEVAV